MGRFVQVLFLVMCGVMAVVLSHEVELGIVKPGGCPEVPEDQENNTDCVETKNKCDSDQICDGSLKCCETKCGYDCVPPFFRSPCEDNRDCPWTLKCCDGVCDSDCIYQPKNKDTSDGKPEF
ncbi:WAP four-disulfide core domain protein 12-like [Hyperolius riggenbachi]|uniref:WAP four-disulfide core domain protein 12-like n=1 Tax=Hyperolius riggenbachi TaxID=752182 RepID=UPI0035A2B495